MIKVDDYYFDFEAVDNCWEDLFKVEGVDQFTLTYNTVKKINSLLGVDQKKTETDIRAIRNAVVDRLHPLVRDAKNTEDWKKYSMWMSAITAAIDHELNRRGFRV